MPATWHEHLRRLAPDYKLVRRKVDQVLEENFIANPPVPVREIANNYAVVVLFSDFGEHLKHVSGFLDLDSEAIYVNSAESPARQNFTIAHELGHYLLHKELFKTYPKEYTVLLRAPIGAAKDSLEQEANAFAAHLLVPRALLDQYYKIASRSELARLFNVSEDVIGYRLTHEYRSAA